MNEHTRQIIYSKQISIVFLAVVKISIMVTLSPAIKLRYVWLDTAFFIVFFTEIIISTFWLSYLASERGKSQTGKGTPMYSTSKLNSKALNS